MQNEENSRMSQRLSFHVSAAILLATLLLLGCRHDPSNSTGSSQTSSIQADFSTPEGAILCLENAYRSQDLEAAVKCKDFPSEARLMLEKVSKLPKDQIDDEITSKTAEVLELAYRSEMKAKGFPDMKGVVSTFPKQEPGSDGIVTVTEVCRYPDGGTSTQKMLVAKTANGWRVLNPVD